jgi:hypothetical protein
MDKKLQIIERLYGDAASGSDDPPQSKTEVPSVSGDETREERLLAEAKFVMDHRTTTRPSPATIDRIVAYAIEQRQVEQRQVEQRQVEQRQAQARARRGVGTSAMSPTTRILPLFPWRSAVAAVFVLFVVGIAYWRIDFGPAPVQEKADAVAQVAPDVGAERVGESRDAVSPATQPAAPLELEVALPRSETVESDGVELASARAANAGLADADMETDSVPAWDAPSDLRMLQKRIEMLGATGQDLDWGEPVPLEQLPVSAAAPGIRAASTGNQNNR